MESKIRRVGVASVFSESLQAMGALTLWNEVWIRDSRSIPSEFARGKALFCYVIFYKSKGLVTNYQGFGSYICHSR